MVSKKFGNTEIDTRFYPHPNKIVETFVRGKFFFWIVECFFMAQGIGGASWELDEKVGSSPCPQIIGLPSKTCQGPTAKLIQLCIIDTNVGKQLS
jgi:hypothetical protein